MSTQAERDWEAWSTEWREAIEPSRDLAADLRSRVRRQTRRLRLAAWGEGAVAIGMLALSAVTALAIRTPQMIVWAAAVWIFVFVAWGFSIRNRRGLFSEAGATTRDFLTLWRLRCERKIRTVRFAWGLLSAEILFLVIWEIWQARTGAGLLAARPDLFLLRYGLLALFAAGIAAWAILYRRSALREREEIARLQGALEADAPLQDQR